jgi:Dolichyl-phosphate-mannose-protein mannosyltransferase
MNLAASSRPWSLDRAADALAVAILLIVALIAALTFRDYGLGWDDYTHSEYGELLLALYSSGFRDTRALSFVNLYMYGGGFDMVAALLANVLPFDLFETRRLVGAGVGIVGLFATWRIGRHLGGPVGGLIALLLLATCPLYYGHMFMNPKDAPFAVAMTVLLLALVRVFAEYPQPRPATGALFGVGLGLTIGSRILGAISGLYALPALALILAAETRSFGWRSALARLGRFALMLVPPFLLAYLVMGFVWPWSVLEPLNPLRALQYFSHFFEKPWKEMFAGALLPVPDMPRSYLPTLFSLTVPEVLLGLGIAGTAGAFVASMRGSLPINRRAVFLLAALAATLPIAITVLTRPAMYNGIRHFVFVVPPFAALGGLAGAWIFDWLRAHGRGMAAAAAALFLVGIMVPLVDMVRLHPYQYTHFNRLSGGIRTADERYMLDYWGLAFKQASEDLRERLRESNDAPPSGRHWVVAVCGPHRPAQVALGPQFETTWDSRGADFALMLGEFYCADLPAPILVEIVREDRVYARVYDIRGRSVSSLLTVPPPE